MYWAPGTAIRQSAYENSSILATIFESAGKLWGNMKEWTNIQYICYVLLLLIIGFKIAESEKTKYTIIHPGLIAIISLALLGGMLCVPYYAMGNFGEGRIENVIWVSYMLLTAVNIIYLTVWIIQRKGIAVNKRNVAFNSFFIFILCIILGITGNGKDGNSVGMSAMNELMTGGAPKYAWYCDERYRLMRESDEEYIYVDRLPESELLKFDDLRGNPNDWRSSIWMQYYGRCVLTNE